MPACMIEPKMIVLQKSKQYGYEVILRRERALSESEKCSEERDSG